MKSKFLILAYESLQDLVLDESLSDLVNPPPPTATYQHQLSMYLLSSYIKDYSVSLYTRLSAFIVPTPSF